MDDDHRNVCILHVYSGVNPQVYALYVELYGTAGAKPIARWTLDIYATPVMIDDVREMLHAPELKARVEVAALNEKFDVVEFADRSADESFLYRCCCRCEFLIPCLGRLLGGPTYKVDTDDQKKRKKKRKKSQRRRRRSYDYDNDEGEEEDSVSEEELETRGLLG